MSQLAKLLLAVLSGTADANINFARLCKLLEKLGFTCRIRGDHHIFFKEGVDEIVNLQPLNAKCKPYQVKQVRALILKYKLGDADV